LPTNVTPAPATPSTSWIAFIQNTIVKVESVAVSFLVAMIWMA